MLTAGKSLGEQTEITYLVLDSSGAEVIFTKYN